MLDKIDKIHNTIQKNIFYKVSGDPIVKRYYLNQLDNEMQKDIELFKEQMVHIEDEQSFYAYLYLDVQDRMMIRGQIFATESMLNQVIDKYSKEEIEDIHRRKI